MLFKNLQATTDRHFKDQRSYVRTDGTEVLYGRDWEARLVELLRRANGQCEWHGPLARCRKRAEHAHHMVKRSIRRDDSLRNLTALCRMHHKMLHPEKQVRWSKDERRKANAIPNAD